jgi:predicted lysophospholipase L1 biosynthesis ABC-type transport system permease subunit
VAIAVLVVVLIAGLVLLAVAVPRGRRSRYRSVEERPPGRD